MRLTIAIKAFNEEKNIAACVESAIAAVDQVGGEVVLADSGSQDRTIAIARGFPIRIVQLANPCERSCGAGAQLGFQYAQGDFFYLLDGDMVLNPSFIVKGIAFLEENPDVAGVGGGVREMNLDGEHFQISAVHTATDPNRQPGTVDRLDGGGLYRMSALRDVIYFADRNLHSFEEFDLAARLARRGWLLARIDQHAVNHFGHKTNGYRLLARRVRSGYAYGVGEVLRGALGSGHLAITVRRLQHVQQCCCTIIWWLALLGAGFVSVPSLAVLFLLPVAILAYRRRSLRLGMYSFITWNVTTAGLIWGLAKRRVSPTEPLASMELTRKPEGDNRATDAVVSNAQQFDTIRNEQISTCAS